MTTSTAPIPSETTAITPVQAANTKTPATPTKWAIFCDHKFNDVLYASKCRRELLTPREFDPFQRRLEAWTTSSASVVAKLKEHSAEIEVIPADEALAQWTIKNPRAFQIDKKIKTYPHREQLKAIGCKWSAVFSCWCAFSLKMRDDAMRILKPELYAFDKLAEKLDAVVVDPTLKQILVSHPVGAGYPLDDPEKRPGYTVMVIGIPRLTENAPGRIVLDCITLACQENTTWEIDTVLIRNKDNV